MALKEFRLPDIGEGIAEGEIVSWKVQKGQQVKEEDEFVEVMTDKATVMITVPFDGVISDIRFAEGEVVPVETVIAVIDTAGAGAASAPAEAATPAAAPAPAPQPVAAAPAPQPVAAAPAPQPVAATPATQPVAAGTAVAFEQASPGKVLAAPATRRRAREMGVDLHQVNGTGPRGRITNDDLQNQLSAGGVAVATAAPAAARPAAAATRTPVAIAPSGGEERIPFRGMRRKIAEAMSRSKSTAAHFTYVDDINVTELVKLRKEAKAKYQEQGVNITYLPFIMKAIVQAMREFPSMNAALDETTEEIVVKHYYNFGIATDTDNGLIVPVIKNVDQKTIVQLAHDIQTIAQKSRDGSISVDDLKGGTFTITNAGNIGGLFATPVINFPEVAILGVHAIKKTPVVTADDKIEIGQVMYLSISIDHRLVDGATGARWMNVVKDCLENPLRLLLG